MKTRWKVFWIVCAVAATLGVAVCVIGIAMGAGVKSISEAYRGDIIWSHNQMWDDDGEDIDDAISASSSQKNTTASDSGEVAELYSNITNLDVAVTSCSVIVKSCEENTIGIDTSQMINSSDIKVSQDGDELNVGMRKKVWGSNKLGTITIYIPRDVKLEELTLDVGAGQLSLDRVEAEELTLKVGAGEATLQNVDADSLDVQCGAGQVTISGNVSEEADIQCGVGEVTYTTGGSESDYNYDVKCGIGEVRIGDSSFSGLGENRRIDNNSAADIELDCGIGKITVSFDLVK